MEATLAVIHDDASSSVKTNIFRVVVYLCDVTDSYWAECTELQGCNTSGATLREIALNMYEAVDLCLEDQKTPVCDYILVFDVRDG